MNELNLPAVGGCCATAAAAAAAAATSVLFVVFHAAQYFIHCTLSARVVSVFFFFSKQLSIRVEPRCDYDIYINVVMVEHQAHSMRALAVPMCIIIGAPKAYLYSKSSTLQDQQ